MVKEILDPIPVGASIGRERRIPGGSYRRSIACSVWAATAAGIISGRIGGVVRESIAIDCPAPISLRPVVNVAFP